MKKIQPTFNDDRDKMFAVATVILSIFLFFVPSLVVVLLFREQVSDSTYQICKSFLNLEILLLIISFLFVIPIIGWLLGVVLGPLLVCFNALICLINLFAIAKQEVVRIPVPYEFI
ncbi:MAG: hypothetical protein E7Z89_03920 [Cyanobacteria bacterium SIG28]|nr:hypothetical protein [Cyanobacteria bacterium SIG28]